MFARPYETADEHPEWHVLAPLRPYADPPMWTVACLRDLGDYESFDVRTAEPERLERCADCLAAVCKSDRHFMAHLLFGNCPACRTASNGAKQPYWHLPDEVDLTEIERRLDEAVGV